MENRAAAMVERLSVGVIVLALCAMAANAQTLQNGGFETGSPGPTPANWTTFNAAATLGTNCPGDANNNCYPTYPTVHGGDFSLKTYGPFNLTFDASGAFQDVSPLPAVGTTWKVSGYLLNSASDSLSGSNGYGVAQIKFLDAGSVEIQTNATPAYGTDVPLPIDQWTAFQVVATVPSGAVTMRVYLLHVGIAGAGGSVWWDDVSLSQRFTTTNVVTGVTSQSGVQVAWPTPQLGTGYQVKTATNLTTLNLSNPSWTNFGSVVYGCSNSNQVFDAIGSAQQKFYNVQQQ